LNMSIFSQQNDTNLVSFGYRISFGMPKFEKKELLERLGNFSVPLMWRDFKTMLEKGFGFKMYTGRRGSARAFIKGEVTFTAHEPHGREKWVSRETRKKAIQKIAEAEADDPEGHQEQKNGSDK
jgi:hypothetical protein